MAHCIVFVRLRALPRVFATALLLVSMLWAGGAPASANPAVAVSLDSMTDVTVLNEDGTGVAEGTFTASGPGAAALCPEGDVVDRFITISDDAGPRIATATETYTCDDGSGSFEVKFRGRRTGIDEAVVMFTAKVVINNGTGAYVDLRAEGTGVTVLDLSTGQIDNAYELDVHRS